jgi:hypothetical protein
MTTRPTTTAVLAALFLTYGASALAIDGPYRPGEPEVLTPAHDPQAEAAAIVERHRRARPKGRTVALYWNREPVRRGDEKVKQTVIDRWHAGSVTPTWPGGVATEGRGRTVITESEGVREEAQPARDGPGERHDWQLRSAFVETLRAAGLRIVDPGTAGLGKGRKETGSASVLLEVLMTRDAAAANGWSFRVSVRDVASGAVLGETTTFAEASEESRPYVATDRGFERSPLTLSDVGHTLALDTLGVLSSAGL